MENVYVIDAVRTPIGKYGGALAAMRPDDMLAHVIKALIQRNPNADVNAIEDVIAGAANQAGEAHRNVARMAALPAGGAGKRGGTGAKGRPGGRGVASRGERAVGQQQQHQQDGGDDRLLDVQARPEVQDDTGREQPPRREPGSSHTPRADGSTAQQGRPAEHGYRRGDGRAGRVDRTGT